MLTPYDVGYWLVPMASLQKNLEQEYTGKLRAFCVRATLII